LAKGRRHEEVERGEMKQDRNRKNQKKRLAFPGTGAGE